MFRTLLLILTFFPALGNSEQRCAIHVESLDYPRLAWQARIEGEVSVRVHVRTNGQVSSASASSGHRLLQDAAKENIKKWVFIPGKEEEIDIVYEFKLERPEVQLKQSTRVKFDLPYHVVILSNLPKLNT